ncbi:MAG: FAD-binding oxidoreductase [Methylocystis sp.]|uniref:FAD-binding oxidoreductase n=1 Tax=Methylocystis sp. TaxID=1911079 RepID=UPI003DA4251D
MDTSRRHILRGGAALVAGAMADAPRRGFAGPALASSDGLGALARSLKGRLIRPGETGYVQAALPNNTRYAETFPRAVAICANDSDVQLCVAWARDNRAPFAVKSGGHNYAGFSVTEGLLIDVRAMKATRLDARNGVVYAQAGVNNAIMAATLSDAPLAVPAGRCLTVGVAGLTMGGGWGFTATRAGLTCDSLLASEVVLADGRKVLADARNNADLFWGLRGGGGGNFGVNTSFAYRLADVSGPVTAFQIVWPANRFVALVSALQAIENENVRQMSMRLALTQTQAGANPSPDELEVDCLGQFFGSRKQLLDILAPAFSISPPASQQVQEGGFWQAAKFLAEPGLPHMFDSRSAYVATALSPDALDTLLRLVTKWPGGAVAQDGLAKLFAIGGKVRDVPADATAYAHRNANYIFEIMPVNDPSDRDDVIARQADWLAATFEAMQRHLLPASYVNFPNRSLPGWAQRYYGANLGRLSQVKRRYDPDNAFRFAQSIPLFAAS